MNSSVKDLISREEALKKLNEESNLHYGIRPEFTTNVRKVVNTVLNNRAGIIRSSLDFDYQKDKIIAKDFKVRYDQSQNLDRLKLEFVDNNEIPLVEEVRDENTPYKLKNEEYVDLHKKALEKLPYFKMV
jgi:hypothetical protein